MAVARRAGGERGGEHHRFVGLGEATQRGQTMGDVGVGERQHTGPMPRVEALDPVDDGRRGHAV